MSQQDICASLLTIHLSLRRYDTDKPFLNILRPNVALKMGSRSPKSNESLSMSTPYIFVLIWSKSIHFFRRYIWCRQAIFQHSKTSGDLENKIKVTKNYFFMSQQYICASLVILYSFLLEMWCRQSICQHSKNSCDLEKVLLKMGSELFWSRSQNLISPFSSPSDLCKTKISQNQSIQVIRVYTGDLARRYTHKNTPRPPSPSTHNPAPCSRTRTDIYGCISVLGPLA